MAGIMYDRYNKIERVAPTATYIGKKEDRTVRIEGLNTPAPTPTPMGKAGFLEGNEMTRHGWVWPPTPVNQAPTPDSEKQIHTEENQYEDVADATCPTITGDGRKELDATP